MGIHSMESAGSAFTQWGAPVLCLLNLNKSHLKNIYTSVYIMFWIFLVLHIAVKQPFPPQSS